MCRTARSSVASWPQCRPGCATSRSAVQENRRLNRRVAELTDVVAELLVPLADRDEEKARELLATYRNGLPGALVQVLRGHSLRVVGRVEEDVPHLRVRLADPSLDLLGRLLELVDAWRCRRGRPAPRPAPPRVTSASSAARPGCRCRATRRSSAGSRPGPPRAAPPRSARACSAGRASRPPAPAAARWRSRPARPSNRAPVRWCSVMPPAARTMPTSAAVSSKATVFAVGSGVIRRCSKKPRPAPSASPAELAHGLEPRGALEDEAQGQHDVGDRETAQLLRLEHRLDPLEDRVAGSQHEDADRRDQATRSTAPCRSRRGAARRPASCSA